MELELPDHERNRQFITKNADTEIKIRLIGLALPAYPVMIAYILKRQRTLPARIHIPGQLFVARLTQIQVITARMLTNDAAWRVYYPGKSTGQAENCLIHFGYNVLSCKIVIPY